MGCKRLINGIDWCYNPLTNVLLTSWDIFVDMSWQESFLIACRMPIKNRWCFPFFLVPIRDSCCCVATWEVHKNVEKVGKVNCDFGSCTSFQDCSSTLVGTMAASLPWMLDSFFGPQELRVFFKIFVQGGRPLLDINKIIPTISISAFIRVTTKFQSG